MIYSYLPDHVHNVLLFHYPRVYPSTVERFFRFCIYIIVLDIYRKNTHILIKLAALASLPELMVYSVLIQALGYLL